MFIIVFLIKVAKVNTSSLATLINSTNNIAWWKCCSFSGPVVKWDLQGDGLQTSFRVALLTGFKPSRWPTSLPRLAGCCSGHSNYVGHAPKSFSRHTCCCYKTLENAGALVCRCGAKQNVVQLHSYLWRNMSQSRLSERHLFLFWLMLFWA